jgi:hypothetical protein
MDFHGRLCDVCKYGIATYKCFDCGRDLCPSDAGIIYINPPDDRFSVKKLEFRRTTITNISSPSTLQIDGIKDKMLCEACSLRLIQDVSKLELANRIEIAIAIYDLLKPYFAANKI